MHKKPWLYGGLAILIVLGLLLGAVLTGIRRIPTVNDQLSTTQETSVLIISPQSGEDYPADAAIPITAMATSSQPMTSMELWVDGSLFTAQSPGADEDPQLFYKTWRWMPLIPGEHILVVRAVNLDGSVAISNLLRINAGEAAGFVLQHTIQAGETWESLAQSCDTSIETIAGQNPGLDSAAPLPGGEQIDIPCGSLFPSPVPDGAILPPLTVEPDSSPDSPPNNIGFWLNHLFSPDSEPASAPNLTAGLDGCTIQLLVQDNSSDELGFEIWRTGTSGFDQIATLGPNAGTSFSYQDNVEQSGQVQYIVSSFTSGGKSPSNIVAVNVPDGACGEPKNPDVGYANGILTVPTDLNLAYLYASLDEGSWQRLPAGNDFFIPSNGQVDLNQYLDPLLITYPEAKQARLKIWGWNRGALQDLGSLNITFDHTSLKFCNLDDPKSGCIGDMGSTHWVTTGEVPKNALNSTRTFSFSANTGAPFVLVQISSRPFGGTFQLEDPYLVHSILVSPETYLDDYITGKFNVNFSFLQQQGGSDQSVELIQKNPVWLAGEPSAYDENLVELMNTNIVGFQTLDGLPEPTYYIRVIPWDNDKPVGGLSNTVVLTYRARLETPPISIDTGSTPSYDLEILSYSPEQKVNPASFGCVIITAIDEAKLRAALNDQLNIRIPGFTFNSNLTEELINFAVNQFKDAMAHGDALCPAPLPEESTWDYVVDQLTEFWKSVVQAFNAIKNSLVNVVAEGLNGLFGPDFCGETCKAGLMTALNYSITYFTGIPPTLPSFGELVEHGIDYTVSLAISEAGIPCDADCAAEIRAGVQTVADAVTTAQSQPGCNSAAAHFYGKQPLCLPDGLTTIPVPGGVYIPGITTIQATRNGQGFQWSSESDYSVLITTTVRNEAVVGQTFWFYGPMWYAGHQDNLPEKLNFPYTIPETMEGSLFEPASMVLPDTLDTGSQLVIPVTLNSLTYAPLDKGYIYPPLLSYALGQAQAMGMPDNLMEDLFWNVQSNSNWYLSKPGYSITVEAVLLCYDKVALVKIPCSEPVTRTFSAEEVQALRDQLNEVQP